MGKRTQGDPETSPSRSVRGSAAKPSAGSGQASLLAKLGIRRDVDLVLHLPSRYEDETRLCPVRDLVAGMAAQVEVEVIRAEVQFRGRRTLVVEAAEGEARLVLRFLHFYPSQQRQLQPGVRVRALGEVRVGPLGAEMVHPRYRVVGPGAPLPDALTPVYPTVAGLSQGVLRAKIERALEACDLADTLDADTLEAHGLMSFADSVKQIHKPSPDIPPGTLEERTHPAWRRVKFDELLAQQLSMRIHYRERRRQTAPALPPDGPLASRLKDALPFALTRAQTRVSAEISRDLARAHPMQRLLQGDVGSGKTVVAALACAQAIDGGCQAALMAPTELLAEQHFRKIAAAMHPLGVETAWLTGALRKADRDRVLSRVASGEAGLVVGTHALFQGHVEFRRLGLAVIDEQHRFGVEQRLALRAKAGAGIEPHQLMMSATPIPRTLSMSYFADLDVSVIDELPPGRTPVATRLVADSRRDEVVERVRAACAEGAQAYWVCPLVEESEALDLSTALDTFEALRSAFPDLRVGLVHGRMSAADKAEAMAAFASGAIELLVATTVIEVGVDVPNATLMVIEHAERMGLAQLHQLRGRVGRGMRPSVCVLMYQAPLSDNARKRLKVMYETVDGFEIARQDLLLRGPGEYLGARQSGSPLLRFADIEHDRPLIEQARRLSDRLLVRSPEAAMRHLERWLPTSTEFLKV